jgi:hypothetical protein
MGYPNKIAGQLALSTTVVTGAGAYTAANETIIVVNKTSGAATTINLPPVIAGQTPVIIVKDGKGDASTHNITVTPHGSDTIDGASSHIISVAYGAAIYASNGTQWNVVAYLADPSGGTDVFPAITGGATPFSITGQAAASGTAAGGAIAIAGAAGGATSGAGGAVSMTGGAGTAGTATGGAGSVTGGAGSAGGASVAGGVGGASSVIGGAGGANATTGAGGSGGVASVTGGAGGNTASSGADNAGNGANAVITGGAGGNATAGTGNGGAGGNVNLVPGAGGTTTGGTAGAAGEVEFNGAGLVTHYFQSGAASATNETFFLATRAYRVKAVKEIHDVAAGGASTIDIIKDTGTGAMTGGSSILSATINLNATARTVQSPALTATTANLLLAAGDRLSIKFNNTIQSTVGLSVAVELCPM